METFFYEHKLGKEMRQLFDEFLRHIPSDFKPLRITPEGNTDQ